jgi:hypothetical protein
MSSAFKSIPTQKERGELQFEGFGVVVEAKDSSSLCNSRFYDLG